MVEPVRYPRYTGTNGSTQGEMNDNKPAVTASGMVMFAKSIANLHRLKEVRD
jgi:hypothetical protein